MGSRYAWTPLLPSEDFTCQLCRLLVVFSVGIDELLTAVSAKDGTSLLARHATFSSVFSASE